MTLVFVYLPQFDRSVEGYLSDSDLWEVEGQLLANPQVGAVIAGTGGVRKLRVALPGRGKSGSGRIIYLYVSRKARVYFLLFYPKNRLANLTNEQKHVMRRLAQHIEES